MPLPAALLLQPDCPIKPAWAKFDPVWYLKNYGKHLPPGLVATPAGLLADYLQRGAKAGHTPNPLFDEKYYISHPDIAALVEAGRYASGFDHYCQIGHRSESGHWLFDDALYADQYDDMALDNLDALQLYGRYDHYLRSGQHEHRLGHLLFDGRFYTQQAIAAGDALHPIEQMGPYSHFLYCVQTGDPELPPSLYFDPVSYAQHVPDKSGPAIAHYLCNPTPHDPVPEFSEFFYIHSNPDVRAARDAGIYLNGYQHFLQTGVFELRQPSAGVDLIFYRDANAMVRNDLNTGAMRDAFAHLRGIGLPAGLPYAPPAPNPADREIAAKTLFLRNACDNLTIFARRPLDFTRSTPGRIAAILVLFEHFELSMHALSTLRGNFAGDIELILVDNASTDETMRIAQYVTGATILRLERNIGYLRACNLALKQVTAGLVLFLNQDVALGFGAVDAAIARLDREPSIGAVGGKIIRAHGRLREAGCIIWRDASTTQYLRDASPLTGEANFSRDVDFCSGVFLFCRSFIVKSLGGFDADFSPASYGDADLCIRMAAAGFRTVYDPAITLHHLEYGSADGLAARAQMQRGQRIFASKHAQFLQTRPSQHKLNLAAARTPQKRTKNILFIEDIIPLRRLGAGYVRANDIVREISAAGHAVTLFPVAATVLDIIGIYADFPDTVEVLHDRDITNLTECLEDRPGYFDLIWVSRTHNLARILSACMLAGIDPDQTPFVLDTEAIATVRTAARIALNDTQNFDFTAELHGELESAPLCRHCVAVNAAEAALLRSTGLEAVSVLGTLRLPDPTEPEFAEREGLLFVASIHQPDSPNLDALHWYVSEILPALMREMPTPPVLNFVGHVAPDIDLSAFANHPHIRIIGATSSLRHHYAKNRLFVAPTRFAAGTPYKLYEAASFGLPIVTTNLLAGQLDWRDGAELMTAPANDARNFAAQIARLYRAPELWARLRQNALSRIARDNTAEAFTTTVADIIRRCSPANVPESGAGTTTPPQRGRAGPALPRPDRQSSG